MFCLYSAKDIIVIAAHFSNTGVAVAIKDGNEYEIRMENGWEIEFDNKGHSGYDIELSNGLDLEFSSNGGFKKIDD